MSSVSNDPELLNQLIQDCLVPVLRSNPKQARDTASLSRIDMEAYTRQGGDIPRRLAEQVEERSDGKYTVLAADSVIAEKSYGLAQGVYFVRVPKDFPVNGRVTSPDPDAMVLFEINPHTSKLTVGVPMRSQEEVDEVLEERAARQAAESERALKSVIRREAVQEEHGFIVSQIERLLGAAHDNHEARTKWNSMRNRHSQHYGKIVLEDLLELCHLLGVDLVKLVARPPL